MSNEDRAGRSSSNRNPRGRVSVGTRWCRAKYIRMREEERRDSGGANSGVVTGSSKRGGNMWAWQAIVLQSGVGSLGVSPEPSKETISIQRPAWLPSRAKGERGDYE